MYHTKSSCLINGKQSNLFKQNDLQAILKLAESKLVRNKTIVGKVNTAIQRLLLSFSPNSKVNATSEDQSFELNPFTAIGDRENSAVPA